MPKSKAKETKSPVDREIQRAEGRISRLRDNKKAIEAAFNLRLCAVEEQIEKEKDILDALRRGRG